MKGRRLTALLVFLNIGLISFFIIQYTSAKFPFVGNDYKLFGPRLLDSLLHYKINGFSIEWYTPSFGGGVPAYPNPLQMQFSFQQLFTFFFNPWIAILVTSVLFITIGFLVTFLFLQDVLKLHPFASILGAGFFVASGFFIERMIVGHTDKISFPLIIIPIYALFNRRLPPWLSGALVGLTGAVLLNSGGVYIGVMCLFTAIVTLPLLYLLQPSLFSWKPLMKVAVWGILVTALLCGSKLYPVVLFMRNFPRTVEDHYFVDLLSSINGTILQLVGVMSTLPFLKIIGKSSLVLVVRLQKLTGSPYGFWEVDSSISPVLILLLVYGGWIVLRKKPVFKRADLVGKIIAGILLVFGVILVFQFASARGFFFQYLRLLPIFKSLRTNTRFTSAYVLPLSVLGAKAFDYWTRSRSPRRTMIGYALLNGISLIALWSYYLLPYRVQFRAFDISRVIDTYGQIQSGATFPVERIIPDLDDYQVFDAGASNVSHHYDPLLSGRSFQPLVEDGSIFTVRNGFYNMTDPTGYVFPSENNSELYSLIPVSETRQFQDFIHRRQPDWKIPLIQIILDWASGITFALVILVIIFQLILRRDPLLLLRHLLPFSRLKRT